MMKILSFLSILAIVLAGLVTGYMLDFIFLYPMFMSLMWIVGGIYFYFQWERNTPGPDKAPVLKEYPFVSIIVPCHNEARNVRETVDALCAQNYPNFEVIAVNDGSADKTGEILESLLEKHKELRVLQLAQNQGKAMALRMGALAANGEYFVCVDGDAMLHPNAVAYLVKPMIENPRVGAVTGNPRVRSRSSFLGKVQVGEFSSIIGLIKRAQRVYGNLFTVSGVVAAFRHRALYACGYWDMTMITEDIDISWAMQLKHWQIQYEPNALCWILMPETLRGLWRQRVRWAQGGGEVLFKYVSRVWTWQDHRMWLLLTDFILSSSWAYAYLLSILLWVCGKFFHMPPALNVPTIFPPAFWGLVLASVNLIQFTASIAIERRYERNLVGLFLWMIWYPLFFWVISMLTTLEGLPRALFKSRKVRAIWSESDRGFR